MFSAGSANITSGAQEKPEPDALEKARTELKKLEEEVTKKRAEVRELEIRKKNQMPAKARYELAESYRERALDTRNTIQKEKYKPHKDLIEVLNGLNEQYRQWTQKAGEQYLELAWLIENFPDEAKPLTEEEQWQVIFQAASTQFTLGKRTQALRLYDVAANKSSKAPQRFRAAAGALYCLSESGRYAEMGKRLEAIRPFLDDLSEEQRKEWTRLLRLSRGPAPISPDDFP
jgi:hypothetical protein